MHQDSGELLSGIAQFLDGIEGLDIASYDGPFLRNSIGKRLAATGIQTVEAYGSHLADNPAEATCFVHSLSINYSEFFRNPLTFALLEQLVLPDLIAEKKRSDRAEIRIWSAAAAAGQEAWSIAILLDELARGDGLPISARIIATDLSEPELAHARTGVYSAESLGNMSLRRLNAFFTRQGEAYAVIPRLRERVDFSPYDLRDEGSASPAAGIYGDFDLILCCNLLFYYRPEIRRQVLGKISRALSPGGYFVTGEAERETVNNVGGFRAVAPPSAIFQKMGQS
ncbi:MAG: protein-glutamate O-methyltransferase CheR [Kiritimatiellia bacterium]